MASLLLLACSFDTNTDASNANRDGAPDLSDGSANAPDADLSAPDANPNQPDADPSCIVWETDFSSDPTGLDLNGDQLPDWVNRNDEEFPTDELSGGIWTTDSFSAVLDTNPKNDFAGRTFLQGQFRSTEVGETHGAVFWINVDYTISDFAPLFLSLRREDDGTQTLRLYGKEGIGTEVVHATVGGLGAGYVDVALDISATADEVSLSVNSVATGTYTYGKLARTGADDRYATAVGYGSEAAFNSMRVEACP
jgi:hypothetical protein